MGVGATTTLGAFILRSISGGGDMGGEAEGTMTGRHIGEGRGATILTAAGGAGGVTVGGVGEVGGAGGACDEGGGGGEVTPVMAEAQEVRCVMRRDDTDGSNEGDDTRKDCTCCAAATNPCWNFRAS